jgi:hypothetical protein
MNGDAEAAADAAFPGQRPEHEMQAAPLGG